MENYRNIHLLQAHIMSHRRRMCVSCRNLLHRSRQQSSISDADWHRRTATVRARETRSRLRDDVMAVTGRIFGDRDRVADGMTRRTIADKRRRRAACRDEPAEVMPHRQSQAHLPDAR